MKVLFYFSFIIFCILIGCAPTVPRYAEPNHNNLDVVVIYFGINNDTKVYDGKIDFGKQFAENIASILQKQNVNALAIDSSSAKNINARYELNGYIIEENQGSQALRTAFGFGSGIAKIHVKSTFTKKDDNKLLSTFNKDRASASWLGNDEILQRLCLELSEDISEDVKSDIKPAIPAK